MTVKTEINYCSDIVRWEEDNYHSRDVITVKSGAGVLKKGTVLGEIFNALTASSAAKSGGNTGNGTLTVDPTNPVRPGAKVGIYQIRCLSVALGTVAAAGASAAMAGNTGNGTITASPATGSGASQGVYTAVCDKEAADGGEFVVRDPTGKLIGRASVGVAFTTQITFTIADGATDWKLGDGFNITVGGEKDETFGVTDPDGFDLGRITVSGVSGTATWDNGLKFALADGTTDWIVGDGFDVTVGTGSGKYIPCVLNAADGSAVGRAILIDDIDATSGDIVCNAITRIAQIVDSMLIYDSSISDATKKAAVKAPLMAAGVKFIGWS